MQQGKLKPRNNPSYCSSCGQNANIITVDTICSSSDVYGKIVIMCDAIAEAILTKESNPNAKVRISTTKLENL